jgi:hypothetical protein
MAIPVKSARVTVTLQILTKRQVMVQMDKDEYAAFKKWQDSYKTEIHGCIEKGEWIDAASFRAGGVRGHTAPRCPLCMPEAPMFSDSSEAAAYDAKEGMALDEAEILADEQDDLARMQ